ncbi:restriction endonuclease subunit S [Oceanimonas sp. AH20CE76]|uniref:restriction endonuclease subunit S n=1 Tax=Oceanimonas sp. AH20CE76 TaxID=2977120 RepID=UPI0031FF3693
MSKTMQEDKKRLVPRLRFPEFRDVEVWVSESAGTVFAQVTNKSHNADLPVLAITQEQGAIPRELIDYHVSVSEKSLKGYKIVEVGDFVISLRSFQGGIEYSNYHGICSPAYVILRLKGGYSSSYFQYYLKTHQFIKALTKNLEGLRDGKMISYKQFSEVFLVIPKTEEQQKIADCLSSLDALIAAQAEKIETLKTHKVGLMQQLFPREGETVPRLRFPEFRGAGKWNVTTLGEVAEVSSGGTPARSKAEYWNGDIPWVSTSLIDFSEIDKAQEYITSDGLNNSSARVVKKGTILMAMYGQGKTRGKVGVLSIDAAINQACAAISVSGKVKSDFLFQNLAGRYDEIRKISNSGGQENLSAALIKGINLIYPDSKSGEQQKIADCLSSIDALITAQADKLDALKAHKKGLMQQLFPSPEQLDI